MELDLFHDRGADDDAIRRSRDFRRLFRSADAEADADRHTGVLLDRGDLRRDVCRWRAVGTGDACPRKCVDESLGGSGQQGDALRRRGRRDEADVFQAGSRSEIGVFRGFIRRKIKQQDPIDARSFRVAMEFLIAVGEDGIQVGEKNDGRLVGFPELADEIEGFRGCHPGFQGAVGGHLVDDTIGKRIGKWQAELDDIRSGGGKRGHDFQGFSELRIARGDVGDECFLVRLAESGKCLGEAVWHGRGEIGCGAAPAQFLIHRRGTGTARGGVWLVFENSVVRLM